MNEIFTHNLNSLKSNLLKVLRTKQKMIWQIFVWAFFLTSLLHVTSAWHFVRRSVFQIVIDDEESCKLNKTPNKLNYYARDLNKEVMKT